ncbi:MAG: TonB-dependent receptor [Bacteroidia bacterium]
MKTTLFLAVLCFLTSSIALGQTGGLSGSVNSAENLMPYVSVVVKQMPDSTVVKTALTDSNGRFLIQGLAPKSYFIQLYMMGYNPYFSSIYYVEDQIKDVGTLEIETNSNVIDNVQVKALRPIIEIQPDKTVFNVENTINAGGSDAFELLRKAPGVIIDNNNAISLEGKGGVQVFIDGKPTILSGDDLVNYLRTLQSTSVDAIELITQPSAKYDAAGTAGIINIKLKRNKNYGTNGSAGLGYSYGVYHRSNASLSLNHRNKRMNIFSNFSNNLGKKWSFIELDRLQQGVHFISETEAYRNSDAYNGKIGIDWYVGKNGVIGVLANANHFNSGSSSTSITQIVPESNPAAFQTLAALNDIIGRNIQATINLNYRYADKEGKEFNVDFDKGFFDRESNSFQPNDYTDEVGAPIVSNNYRMITPTNIEVTTFRIDYVQKLFKGKIGFGAKYSLVNTENSLGFYNVDEQFQDVLNEDRSNDFLYRENVNALYLSYNQSINKKWKYQAGLRAEQTISKGELISTQQSDEDLVERDYLNMFPSAGITYQAGRNHSWSLTAGRRIQRPNYQSLNPFVTQGSELSYRQGNPFLQPQYTWNTKLSHTFKYRFNTSVSYSYITDFFAQVNDTIGDNITFLIPRNVANQQTINFGLSMPFTITKWWSVFINSNTYYALYTATEEKFKAVELVTSGFYAQSTFLMPKGIKLELSGWGRTPAIWGGTYLTKSMGAMNIGAEKKFLNDQLSVRAKFSDIFFSSPWRADLQYGDLEITGTGGWESRRFDFSLSYNFGNSQVKASRNRKTGLDEEQQRTQ